MKAICHCKSCRKLSGGTNTLCCLVPLQSFQYESGSPVKSAMVTHEEGNFELTVNFCSDCGTSCHKEAELFDGVAIIFAGTLDDGEALLKSPPNAELWVKDKLPWLGDVKGAKLCQEFDSDL